MKGYEKLSKMEQSIVLFFVWREMNGEKDWYDKGCKELAREINRNEKSVQKALISLKRRKKLAIQKNSNRLEIKHTLSVEELNTRVAFISEVFCSTESMLELKTDLEKENKRLDDGILNYREKFIEVEIETQQIKSVLQNVSKRDIKNFVEKVFSERTWANSNKPLKEIISYELPLFMSEMFTKYAEQTEEGILKKTQVDESNIYDEFWSRNKQKGI